MVATKFQTKMWTKETIEKASKKIELYCKTHKYELESVNTSPEDFKQEMFLFWCNSRGYNNYDPNKKGFENFVLLICKRHLGDLIKKRDAKMRIPLNIQTSMDLPLYEGQITFGDTIIDPKSDIDYDYHINEIKSSLPKYNIELSKKTINVSYYQFFEDYLSYELKELTILYNISLNEVKEALTEIRDYIKFKFVDKASDKKDIYYIKQCLSILPDTKIELTKKTLKVTYKELYKNYFCFSLNELAKNYSCTMSDIKEALTEITDYLTFKSQA